MAEVLSLQRQLEVSLTEQHKLQDQIQAERKRAEKQIVGLKDAIQAQRAQLEKALSVRCALVCLLQQKMCLSLNSPFPGGEHKSRGTTVVIVAWCLLSAGVAKVLSALASNFLYNSSEM